MPTNDGLALVFAVMPQRRFLNEIRFDLEAGFHRVILECAPELAEPWRMARGPEASEDSRVCAASSTEVSVRGWALVGDAGYFKDPISAHGTTDALRDAELLSRAVAEDTESALSEYQEARDQLSYALFDLTDEIAGYQWDLDSVKRMHLQMSEAMNREVAFLTELDEELAFRTA
jgi:2-polyprenyl-6-methoxyphenol hydroxylase-like FAD-dependent oxidoreductase